MRKLLKMIVFVLIAFSFSACEFMNEDVEPIIQSGNSDGPVGGQTGGNNPEEPE